MSHHIDPSEVEVVFHDYRGQYRPGQIAVLPVDAWLLSILRGGSVSIINPPHVTFNKDAQTVEEIWGSKEAPVVVKIESKKEEPKVVEEKAERPKRLDFSKIDDTKFVVKAEESAVDSEDGE